MRVYTCHILHCNCYVMVLNFINFCCSQILFAVRVPLLSSSQVSPVISKVMKHHLWFKYVRFVRVITKQWAIQPLALVRMQRLFFRIVSKEHEYASCRSTSLVKSLQAAGVPMFPGAAHEFA
jgi:hypothetical protein